MKFLLISIALCLAAAMSLLGVMTNKFEHIFKVKIFSLVYSSIRNAYL